ncbi:MAG: hypothetical protein KBS64_01850 [Treponema sp.]|nr:hypothetical protein [Candidatus Treponema equi]
MKAKVRVVLLVSTILLSVSSLFAQSTKAVVTGIKAEPSSGNSVTVTWNSPAQTTEVSALLLYRGTKPFTSYNQVEDIEPAATLRAGETSYTDMLRTSQEYFYVVISVLSSKPEAESAYYYDEETDGKEVMNDSDTVLKTVLPGVNATVKGARVQPVKRRQQKAKIQKAAPQKKTYENGELRETPLPYIDVLDEKPVREPTISPESKRMAKNLAGTSNKTYKREPLPVHIFEEDLVSPAGGDEYLLFEILKTYFIRKQYTESISTLRKFLAQNRTKEVSDRAAFYLGEAYYYTGNFPSALTRFLALEETYPELSRQWIDSTLDQFN